MTVPSDQWVILELSSKADGEDPDLIRKSITYAVRGAEVFIPAAVTQVGGDRVVHYLVEGYAFIRHDHPDASYNRLENSKYVQSVVTKVSRVNNGRPVRELARISTSDVERMKRQIHAETDQGIGVNDTVLITSGAYKQIEARVIEDIPEEDKVQVHIQLRSKDTIVSLPRSFLKLVKKAPKAPATDQLTSIYGWVERARPLLQIRGPYWTSLKEPYQRFARLEAWVSRVSALTILVQGGTNYSLDPLLAAFDRFETYYRWVDRLEKGAREVQWAYLKFDLTRVTKLLAQVESLTLCVERWSELVPIVQQGPLGPTVELNSGPLQEKYFRLLTILSFQEQLFALDQSLDDLEDDLHTEMSMDVDNIVVDGFNLAYRCFYAPGMSDMRDTQGRHTGVLFGFIRVLASLKKRYPEAQFHVVWDGSNQRRKVKFAGYKAERTSSFATAPDGYGRKWDQVAFLRETLPLLGVAQYYNSDEEADDVIASLVRGALKGQSNLILSTDRDMYQLLTPTDRMLLPTQGKRKETIYEVDTLKSEWGVGPDQIVILRSFLGDNSDNLPGVPTVPQHVITELVQFYGTVDGVYASNLAGLTKKRYELIRGAERQVRLNLELMTLQTVPFTVVPPAPDPLAATDALAGVDVQSESLLSVLLGSAEMGVSA